MANRFPFLNDSFVQSVMSALGPEHVRVVGGAVRDALVEMPINDIDLATTHTPEQTIAILEKAGVKVIPTGIDHGTVTAVADTKTIEITTLRHDVETDGRHANVSFTADWLEDAKRRDFTINAMYINAEGDIFDPFDGALDAANGCVRFIGEAGERITEDALRMLRFFRFYAHYGTGPMDAAALKAIAKNLDLIGGLSVERVRDEILKLLKADEPAKALDQMKAIGLLDKVLPVDPTGIGAIGSMEKSKHADDTLALRRLFLLVNERDREDFFKSFKLSNTARKHLNGLSEYRLVGVQLSLKERLYRFGVAVVIDGLLITGESDKIEEAAAIELPVFPIKGRDLVALGHEKGPAMGETLKTLETRWVASDFSLAKEDLLASL